MKKLMKLVIVSIFCFSINVYSETEFSNELEVTDNFQEVETFENNDEILMKEIEVEEVEELQEATAFQIIKIMIEEGHVEEAKGMLGILSNQEKDSFEYYNLMGNFAKEDGELEEAISYYSEAAVRNPEDIKIKIVILNLRIENKEDKNIIKEEVDEILKLDLKAEDRKKLEIFAESLVDKKEGKNLAANLSTGISFTDNAYETKSNKQQDFYLDTRFSVAHKLDLPNSMSVTSFASFGNKSFTQENEKNSNSIYFGVEPAKAVSTWNVSIPLTFNQSTEDGDDAANGYSIGVKGRKSLSDGIILTTGLDLEETEDEQLNYDGSSISIYANAKLKAFDGKVQLIPALTYEVTDYNSNSRNYSSFSGSIGAMLPFREVYIVNTSYKLVSKSYDEGGRSDDTHYLKANIESNLGETKWKYNVGLLFKINTSSESSNEYSANTLSYKVIREFN